MDNFTPLQVHDRPVIVMDNGSGYTKMGFHGNAAVRNVPMYQMANHQMELAPIYVIRLVLLSSYSTSNCLFLMQPNFVIPTAISFGGSERRAAGPASCSDDSQVFIGDEALSNTRNSVHYPIRHGVVGSIRDNIMLCCLAGL
jgi:actin-related protein